jgi:hypothetical protein
MATSTAGAEKRGSSDFRLETVVNPQSWHKSTPRPVIKADDWSSQSDGWLAWQQHLASRSQPVGLGKLVPGQKSALCWALPSAVADHDSADWIQRFTGNTEKPAESDEALAEQLSYWLAELTIGPGRLTSAYECLAWCHAAPRLAATLDAPLWWELLATLIDAVATAQRVIRVNEDPLSHQLLSGELALTLAYLFPEIKACRKMRKTATAALSRGIDDLLDGEGLPHARYLASFRPLIACWTRCKLLATASDHPCFHGEAQLQFEWVVRQMLRLSRHDGSQVLTPGNEGQWAPKLFEAALGIEGDDDDWTIASMNLPLTKRQSGKLVSKSHLPESACDSEWAETSILRPDWGRSAPRLVVRYDRPTIDLELSVGRSIFFSGPWDLEISIDGQPARPSAGWEQVCWVEDQDILYLEIETDLGNNWKAQRQVIMPRDGGFALLTDAILGEQSARIDYRSQLALGQGVSFTPCEESTEGELQAAKQRALVLPLSLPEWRIDGRRRGELRQEGEAGLEFSQQAVGSALYAAQFIDLSSGRRSTQHTWRNLTVGHEREIQPPHIAVGFRVQIGKKQWLIYRSLAETAPRSVLGHNLASEFLLGSFDRDGLVDPLIEIE